MLSSRSVVNADIFTEAHRISCRIAVGPSGLVGQLNDATTSLLDVEDVYFSRLQQPAKIVAQFESAHVNKAHLTLVVLARREDLGPQGLARGGYTRVFPVSALVTTPEYEVQGTVEVVRQFDAAELLVGGAGRFLQVYNAAAVATLYGDTSFAGGVILVNRGRVEMIAQNARGKA
jgi:hypothetical protein